MSGFFSALTGATTGATASSTATNDKKKIVEEEKKEENNDDVDETNKNTTTATTAGATTSSLFNSYFNKISKTIQKTTDNVKNFNAQDLTAKIKEKALETHSNLLKEKDNFINIMKDEKLSHQEPKDYEYPWDSVNDENTNNHAEEIKEVVKNKVIKLSEYVSYLHHSPNGHFFRQIKTKTSNR